MLFVLHNLLSWWTIKWLSRLMLLYLSLSLFLLLNICLIYLTCIFCCFLLIKRYCINNIIVYLSLNLLKLFILHRCAWFRLVDRFDRIYYFVYMILIHLYFKRSAYFVYMCDRHNSPFLILNSRQYFFCIIIKLCLIIFIFSQKHFYAKFIQFAACLWRNKRNNDCRATAQKS